MAGSPRRAGGKDLAGDQDDRRGRPGGAVLHYFAYGSNMASAQMAERCPGARCLGSARLPGHRLAFDAWSPRRGGFVADVVPAAAGVEVWGVLWEITEAHAVALDRYEGVSQGRYRRATVRVERVTGDAAAGGVVEALAYVFRNREEEGPTTEAYRALFLEGAREHGLPPAWITTLQRVPVAPAHPDPPR